MNRTTLIIFERSGDWAAALRSQLDSLPTRLLKKGTGTSRQRMTAGRRGLPSGASPLFQKAAVRLLETRTLDECWDRIVEHPTAVAVLELTAANARALLAALIRLTSELPEVRAIVVAKRQLAAYANLVREAGAIHFVVSPRSLSDVAEILRRRALRLESSVAGVADDLEDPRAAILANLPWSDMI